MRGYCCLVEGVWEGVGVEEGLGGSGGMGWR